LKYVLYFPIYECDSIIEETVICINVYQYKRTLIFQRFYRIVSAKFYIQVISID